MFKHFSISEVWAAIATIVAASLLASKFFKDVFGIEAFGKKVYKGAPMIWKWFMRSEIFRKEMRDDIGKILEEQARIRQQVEYNGGTSMKDALRRIENAVTEVKAKVDINATRAEIRDMCSERMTFKADREGSVFFINDAFLRCFGYSESDVLGFAYESLVHDDDVQEMRMKWTRAIEKKTRFYDEQRIMTLDGDCYRCTVKAFPVLVEGELREFFGVIDIIEKQQKPDT